jgi:hypothetical protein
MIKTYRHKGNSTMTAPTYLDLQMENNDMLRQILSLQNDVTTYRARLNEALTELARWKIEALDRRQRMVRQQQVEMVRVPVTGVIGK